MGSEERGQGRLNSAPAFADRLAALVEERRSQICLGLDPDPESLLPEALEGAPEVGGIAEAAAAAVAAHCRLLIDRAGAACVAVKPQLACFERLGGPGWTALAEVARAAQDAGLLVVADGKRGDVPHTAAVYGQALVGSTPTPWGEVAGLGADAITANPLLGLDSLQPLAEAARRSGAGVFVLVRTSNPGAADLQDLDTGGAPLHERIATLADSLGAEGIGDCGLSSIGAVVGATEPGPMARLRELMPRAVFLVPGVGAQGGRPEDLAACVGEHPASILVAAARSVAGAGDPAAAAEQLRDAVWHASGR